MTATLQPETVRAWDHYIQWAEEKVKREISDPTRFLIEDFLPAQERALIERRRDAGEIVAQQMQGVVPAGVQLEVPEGEVHHWWGTVLVRNASLHDLLRFLQDYDHHAGKFADVESSKLLSTNGKQFKFFFRLRRSKAFFTAYYNTEQECTYRIWGPKSVSSESIATRIAELENPGTAAERELSPGVDRGFLWRLVSWWRFQETDKGVIVEIQSASLSRNIPALVRFIPGLSSYIRATPRESMESVLEGIRRHAPANK